MATLTDQDDNGAEGGSTDAPMIIRAAAGGGLMGAANLVPGISGGTMLLASGVYPAFIQAVAEVSTFRFRRRSLVLLGVIALAAATVIILLAGMLRDLVIDHRWIMYSLFIGLTLGGVPVVLSLLKPVTRGAWFAAAIGFLAMGALAWVQQDRAGTGAALGSSNLLMLAAGVVGAGAMILPGISGAYLWLIMGVYVPVLSAVDRFRQAAGDGEWAAAWEPAVGVLLPVGLGVIIGILSISNVLRVLLDRYPKPTLGLLLGLLVGAVAGLWPFQQAVAPRPGQFLHGREVTAEAIDNLPPHEWPVEFFHPSSLQVLASVGLIVVGFALTALLAHVGNRRTNERAPSKAE